MPGAQQAAEAASTTTETSAAATPAGGYDEFSSVFDSLFDKAGTTDDAGNLETEADAGAAGAAADDAQPDQPGDGEGAAGEPAPAGTDAAAADGAGQPAAQGANDAGGNAQPAGQPVVDWEAKYRELEARSQQPAQQPAGATAPATETPAETPLYTEAEQTELAELQAAWPEAYRLFSLLARQTQVDTLKYAFSEFDRVVSPLQQTVGAYAADDHMAAIYEAHADYDQVYQPVMEWVEKQPSFLKAAYQNVIQQGTAADVAEMITRFKQETQWQSPASQPPAQAGAAAPATTTAARPAELSEAAKQAAKAMGAVGTKRGAVQQTTDPNDFDGAWAEANSTR